MRKVLAGALRDLDLEDQERDGDRDDAVAQRFHAALAHRASLCGLTRGLGGAESGQGLVSPRELVCFPASLIVRGMRMNGGPTLTGGHEAVAGWGESMALPPP